MNSTANVDKRDFSVSRNRRSERVSGTDGASRAKRPPRRPERKARSLASNAANSHSADTDSTSEAHFAFGSNIASDVLSNEEEDRRRELLRRLNQITRQKTLLTRNIQPGQRSSPPCDGPPSSARAVTSSNSSREPRTSRFADAEGIAARNRVRSSTKQTSPTTSRSNPMPVDGSYVPAERDRDTVAAASNVSPSSSKAKFDLMMVDHNKCSEPVSASHTPLPRAPTRVPASLMGNNLSNANLMKNAQVSYCLRLVKEMLRLKDAFAFSRPIDRLWSRDQLPGYFEMITQPMDLGTVKARLEAGMYLNPTPDGGPDDGQFDKEAFASDMRLIFSNARTYNRQGDQFYEAATRLLEKFEHKLTQMPLKLSENANQSKTKSKKRKKSGFSVSDRRRTSDGGRRKKQATAKSKASSGGAPSSSASVATESVAPSGHETSSASAGFNPRKNDSKAAKKPVKSKSEKTTDTKTNKEKDRPGRKRIEQMSALELTTRMKLLEVRVGSPKMNGASLYGALARALYDVELSYDEKVYLGHNVTELPPEKLSRLVSLASKDINSSMEVNNNEEVELDIDGLSTKTLRDMQAVVNQALNARKGFTNNMPNGDIARIPRNELQDEMDLLRAAYDKKKVANGKKTDGEIASAAAKKTLYESDSSSDSDDDSSASDSDDSSSGSDDESDSSGDEESPESMRKRRERNFAHQQSLQSAGTPLQSPGVMQSPGYGSSPAGVQQSPAAMQQSSSLQQSPIQQSPSP